VNIVEGVNGLLERRAALVAELTAIDTDLEEIRAALGLGALVTTDEALLKAIVGFLATNGPTPLGELVDHVGLSLYKVNLALRQLSDRVEVLGKTNRRTVKLRTDMRGPAPHVSPVKPKRELASRREDKTCEQCGATFTPPGGSSGRFCSRACYEQILRKASPAPPPAPAAVPASTVLRAKTLGEAVQERRCARCMKKFRPTTSKEYLCPGCVNKPAAKPPPADAEYETVWRPGKDAPSLSGEGLGSSLASESKSPV
jgi:hypothetical protein